MLCPCVRVVDTSIVPNFFQLKAQDVDMPYSQMLKHKTILKMNVPDALSVTPLPKQVDVSLLNIFVYCNWLSAGLNFTEAFH